MSANILNRLAKLEAEHIKPSLYAHLSRAEMLAKLKGLLKPLLEDRKPLCTNCFDCPSPANCQSFEQLLQDIGYKPD